MFLSGKLRGDAFNEAAEHYRQLRHVIGDSPTYKAELVEIIRLCQLAIKKQRGNGDAYVLLANAFSLAADDTRFRNASAFDYFLSRACAVIYEWTSGGVWTRNKEIGNQMLQQVAQDVALYKGLVPAQIEQEMRSLHRALLADALNPGTIEEIQRTLLQ